MKRYLSSIVTKRCKSGNGLPLGRIIFGWVVFAACGPLRHATHSLRNVETVCLWSLASYRP